MERGNFIKSNNDVVIYGPKDMYVAHDRLMLELAELHTQHPWIQSQPEEVRFAKKSRM